MYYCKVCDFVTNNASEIGNHYKYEHNEKVEIECDKCGKKVKSKGGLTYHLKKCKGPKISKAKTCEKCNFLIKQNFEKHFNYCDGSGPRRKKPGFGSGKGWSKGLTKDTDYRVMKISEGMKNSNYIYKPHNHTEETKNKISQLMIDRYATGWESTAGRCKKIEYVSNVAGIIKVDGNWELRVAKYLDTLSVKWIRNKKRFKYNNTIKNCISTYCPDFYVYDWNIFIEVKGYKTELDEIKWIQFKEKIEIWDKNKLNDLGIDTSYKKLKK